jgi:hypothetical protein
LHDVTGLVRILVVEIIAGEPWDIPGILLDAHSSPIDLTGATLEWALVDSGGSPVAMTADVTVIDAAPRPSLSASSLTTRRGWIPATTTTACG